MALSTGAVKARIQATKKTAQITKAMNMVSASKLRGAEKSIKAYLPFIEKIKEIIGNLYSDNNDFIHPLMKMRTIKKVCFVVISTDRGLAGAINSNINKMLTSRIRAMDENTSYVVYPLGLKAYTYAKKMNYPLVTPNVFNLQDDIQFYQVSEVVHQIVLDYLLEKYDKVEIIYTHYVNTLIQKVETNVILPISDISKDKEVKNINKTYEYEGGKEDILNTILPIYIENTIYGMMLDAKASEHASRMNSMQSATDNATEVVANLELLYNRARQAAITLELTDIIGGASVINER